MHRPIAPLNFPDVSPGGKPADRPSYVEVDPALLRVDDRYQRGLSDRSIRLIRKIIANWSWRAFNPPVVVRADDGGLDVLNGQHTAIAAASHPGIQTIMVQVVTAPDIPGRAAAFVSHNRDRISISPGELHAAMVAAGDESALTIAQVCERAGVRMLKRPAGDGRYYPGDCAAIGAVSQLVSKRYAAGARKVLQVCARAKLAPISAAAIKAVDALMSEEQYAGQITPDDIVLVLREQGSKIEDEAAVFAKTHGMSVWRGLAGTIFRRSR